MSIVVARPWGTYLELDRGPTSVVKRIVVNPGCRLSLQSHHHRSEHWTVVEGRGVATVCDDLIPLRPNVHVFIPKNARHRLTNDSDMPLEVIEVQYGTVLTEEDIVRYEDDYDRA